MFKQLYEDIRNARDLTREMDIKVDRIYSKVSIVYKKLNKALDLDEIDKVKALIEEALSELDLLLM